MTLRGLSATELARIDSVCLDFESLLREGRKPSITKIVRYHGGENEELLRQELESIREEVLGERQVGPSNRGGIGAGSWPNDRSMGIFGGISNPGNSNPGNSDQIKPDPSHSDASKSDQANAGDGRTAANGTVEPQQSTDAKPQRDRTTQANGIETDVRTGDNDRQQNNDSPIDTAPPSSGLLNSSGYVLNDRSPAGYAATPGGIPAPGTELGPYRIKRQIGQGGMGVVFSASDERLGRKVAIKMLSAAIAGRRGLVERFDREARAVAAITHPNIVELFDVGNFQGLPYAVMEFLDGMTLDTFLQQEQLAPIQVRKIGKQIADALATAHGVGVIHRDLKPQNIMLVGGDSIAIQTDTTAVASSNDELSSGDELNSEDEPSSDGELSSDGERRSVSGLNRVQSDWTVKTSRLSTVDSMIVKLFDFGLSRVDPFALQGRESQEDSSARTTEGMIMGTPGYMAPEQAAGEAITASADIFSLGCILHEAFYGRRAFEGKTKSQLIAACISDDPKIDKARRSKDPKLAALIADCLQKDPTLRPATATEVADRLQVVTASAAISRRRWLALAASGVALAVGGGATGAILNMRTRERLRGINSLAVLSFTDLTGGSNSNSGMPGKTTTAVTHRLTPVGQSRLTPAETLPGLLVHELTRLEDLIVPSFRPASASTPDEYRQLGKLMEVDAMLTGSVRQIMPSGEAKVMWDLDLQLISSETGTEIWGGRVRTVAGEHLLAQTEAASEIAAVIGRQLTSTFASQSVPKQGAFHCLVDGKMRSDPDSVLGLKRALMCYERAHQVDTTYVDPIAGIALTSITLAAMEEPLRAIELAQQSRNRAREALAIDKTSVDARLAKLMDDWQMLGRYDRTEAGFRELVMTSPDRWQVHHQYALYLMATGRTELAIKRLREASLLSPLSISVRIDLARAYWFIGDTDRAIADAKRILKRPGGENPARGLLIDIYEQQGELQKAAQQDPQADPNESYTGPQTYWTWRSKRFAELPYGAFGYKANQMIGRARVGGLNDAKLADSLEPRMPMLVYVLASHPSLAEARKLGRAAEILPPTLGNANEPPSTRVSATGVSAGPLKLH